MLTSDDFDLLWVRLGVTHGDTVLVHSALRALGPIEGPPVKTVFYSLADAVQVWRGKLEVGTLVFPTFNFDFCATGQFDLQTTPSQMGALSTFALQQPLRTRRTLHPIYSFAVLGGRVEEVVERSQAWSAYRGVFDWLHERNALIVMLGGLTWNTSFTFVHHVEEVVGCDYRYHKLFRGRAVYHGLYPPSGGQQRHEPAAVEPEYVSLPWSMYVRDREHGVLTAIDSAGAEMERQGIAQRLPLGASSVVAVRAQPAFQFIAQILREQRALGLLYTVDPTVKGASV